MVDHLVELWNGLPSILENENGSEFRIVFTNINGKFCAVKLDEANAHSDVIFEEARNSHVFECLENIQPYESEELTAIFSLTEKCNSSCRYCFLDADNEGNEMSSNMISKGVDTAYQIAQDRPIIFAVFGGEPGTVPKLIYELVSYVEKQTMHKNEVNFAITTNGILSEKLIDFLIEKRFRISLSMDGCEEVQNFQRPLANGESSYAKAANTIKRFVKSSLDLKIRITVTAFSVMKMKEAVRVLSSLGVKKIHFEP